MSLDNVLAVSGAAGHHIAILAFGLLFSIGTMGLAANAIAQFLHKFQWIGYVGVLVVFIVAMRMIIAGGVEIWATEHCDQTLKCVPETFSRTLDWWSQIRLPAK